MLVLDAIVLELYMEASYIKYQYTLRPSLTKVIVAGVPCAVKYVRRRSSQGKTSSDQGCQVDHFTLKPGILASVKALLENCRLCVELYSSIAVGESRLYYSSE